MSDISDPGAGDGTGQSSEGQVDPDSLASGFLSGIPEADRPVVEKYIKDWDAGVTKKFQDIHGQYAPYKELGDPETLSQAMQIAELFDSNPEYLLTEISKALGYTLTPPGTQPGQNVPGQQQLPSTPEVPGNLSPEIQARFDEQQQLLTTLADLFLQQKEAESTQQEDQQLESFLADLHKKHGEFDDQYILLQIANDVDADQAVKNWTDMLGKYGTNTGGIRLPPPPPSLSGGTVPSGTKSVTDMDNKETQKLVASIMQAANPQ